MRAYRKPPYLPPKQCPPACDDDWSYCDGCPKNPGKFPDPCPVCGARTMEPCDIKKHEEASI